jgi:putative ribosome biogenesis GTPase RsgA
VTTIGPRTFTREQRHLYFGREREARDLLACVLSERLVLFYAQSGAGKSSLINTQLVPGLWQAG